MHKPMPALLEFDAVSPECIAAQFGTPTFVLSRTVLRSRLLAFAEGMQAAWPGTRLFYSAKANPNPWVLHEALSAGWGIDACSTGDLWLAAEAGTSREAISFTGVGVTRRNFAQVCESVDYLNVCTPAQVEHVAPCSAKLGLRLAAESNRTAIDYASNKFGLTTEEAAVAIEMLRARGMRVRGLHCHAASGITDVDDLVETLSRSLMGTIATLGSRDKDVLEYVNVGGGLGILYDDNAGGVDPIALGEGLAGLMSALSDRVGRRLELHCEPGEWVIGPAGALLMRVIGAFDRGETRVAIMDASLNQFMGTSYSRPDNAVSVVTAHGDDIVSHDLYGSTNSPGDVFCRSRLLPRLQEGDLVILHCAGAYGYSRGGRFNEHPQAPEVLVDGTRFAVARVRETLSVLKEHVPDSLSWIS